MERLKKGFARIEFFAVRQEVEKLLAAGYSIKLAYEDLKQKGKITMSYQAFYRNLKPVKKTVALKESMVPGSRAPSVESGAAVHHDKNPNTDDII
nr:TraK family protein [uncultured Desulfobulbus sp.]